MAEIFDNKIIYNAPVEYSVEKLAELVGHSIPPVSIGSHGGSRYNRRPRPSNPTRKLTKAIRESVAFALQVTADELVDETKAMLLEKHGNGPDWTGELYDHIYRGEVDVGSTLVSVKLYADATNQYNGAMYAQFLEEGTGDKGEGTGPKWRYKGKMRTYVDPETGRVTESEWYTTSGMKADPFLKPPIEAAKERLAERCKGAIVDSFDPHWYKGSLQLWKEKPTPNNTGSGIRTDI